MDRALGMDLDRRRAVGVCPDPLRALDRHWRKLGLGARPPGAASGLRSGIGRLHQGLFRAQPPSDRLVPAGPGGGLLAGLYARPRLYPRRQRPVVRAVDRIALGPNGRPPRQVFETRYVNQRCAVLVPERAFAGARNARLSVLSIAPTRLERVPATFAPPHIRPVIAHPLPPPRRIAAAPPGRQGPHSPPFIKPPPHPAMAETAPAAAGPAVLRGLPRHPATAALRPPAAAPPGLVRPAHPLPPNAAMLPPLPPRQPPLSAGRHAGAVPHRVPAPRRREGGAMHALSGPGGVHPIPHAPPLRPAAHGPGDKPRGAVRPPPGRPHAARQRSLSRRRIARALPPRSATFRAPFMPRGPGLGERARSPDPPPMRREPARSRPVGKTLWSRAFERLDL